MSSTTGKSDLTPYAAAVVATAVLRKHGILDADQEIAPQSMYGNKTITRYGEPRREGGDGVMFNGDSFAEWLDAQVEGRATGARQRVNVKALLAEYDPETDEPESDEDEELVDATTE